MKVELTKTRVIDMKLRVALMLCIAAFPFVTAASEKSPTPAEIRGSAAEQKLNKLVGVDYATLVEGAIRKDAAALRGLFRFTVSPGFDGYFADEHCSVLWGLMHVWGDEAFSAVLRQEKPKVLQAVINAIDYDARPGSYAKRFPKTHSIAKHTN